MIYSLEGTRSRRPGLLKLTLTFIWDGLGLEVPPEKIQTLSEKVHFLEIWWKGEMACIPKDTLSNLEQIKVPVGIGSVAEASA